MFLARIKRLSLKMYYFQIFCDRIPIGSISPLVLLLPDFFICFEVQHLSFGYPRAASNALTSRQHVNAVLALFAMRFYPTNLLVADRV